MKSTSKKILRDLFKSSEGLYTFTLYQRFNISPKELFTSISDLRQLGLVEEENDRLFLSANGREFVITNNISSGKNENIFDKIPEDFVGPKLEINEFYLPKFQNIQRELLSSQRDD